MWRKQQQQCGLWIGGCELVSLFRRIAQSRLELSQKVGLLHSGSCRSVARRPPSFFSFAHVTVEGSELWQEAICGEALLRGGLLQRAGSLAHIFGDRIAVHNLVVAAAQNA